MMRDIPAIFAVQLYLFIRTKCYRLLYEQAFLCIMDTISRFKCARSALIVCYELMINTQEYRPQWWTRIIRTLLSIKDALGEENEAEIKRVLIFALNHEECDAMMRSDIAKISERTFQYIPEVWSEIFSDPNYLMPHEIIHLLVKILLENKLKSWAPLALEILITPTPDTFWKTVSTSDIDILVDICRNESARETLLTKSARPPESPEEEEEEEESVSLLPPPMPPQELLGMDRIVSPNGNCIFFFFSMAM
jgi:hypothetical protein